jgi:hypothetical protein
VLAGTVRLGAYSPQPPPPGLTHPSPDPFLPGRAVGLAPAHREGRGITPLHVRAGGAAAAAASSAYRPPAVPLRAAMHDTPLFRSAVTALEPSVCFVVAVTLVGMQDWSLHSKPAEVRPSWCMRRLTILTILNTKEKCDMGNSLSHTLRKHSFYSFNINIAFTFQTGTECFYKVFISFSVSLGRVLQRDDISFSSGLDFICNSF